MLSKMPTDTPKREPVQVSAEVNSGVAMPWRNNLKVTDRLLACLGERVSGDALWGNLEALLGDTTTKYPVLVYGTTGAGKTRLVLEYLHGHLGMYLSAVEVVGSYAVAAALKAWDECAVQVDAAERGVKVARLLCTPR